MLINVQLLLQRLYESVFQPRHELRRRSVWTNVRHRSPGSSPNAKSRDYVCCCSHISVLNSRNDREMAGLNGNDGNDKDRHRHNRKGVLRLNGAKISQKPSFTIINSSLWLFWWFCCLLCLLEEGWFVFVV